MTKCQLKPWGAACEQDAAGLIRDRDGKTHPACRWHLWAAEEFDWQPVTLDEVVRGAIDAHMVAALTALGLTKPEPVEIDFDDDKVLPLHRAGTFPAICPSATAAAASAAPTPRTERTTTAMKSAYGYIIVNGNTEELDWDGELHPTVESAIESLTAQCTGYARTEKGAADSDREVWWSTYNIHPVGERIKVGESERPGCVGDPAVTLDAPEGIPAAFVEKASQAIDWERHEYRVNRAGSPADWVPYCQCGWEADREFAIEQFDIHLATLALEAVYADIKAEALREAAAEMRRHKDGPSWNLRHPNEDETWCSPDVWLEELADRLAGGETE